MAAMKACYKSSLKTTKKKRHTSSCRKKRSLDWHTKKEKEKPANLVLHEKAQKVRMRRRCPSEVNLWTKRYTQRRAVNLRTTILLARWPLSKFKTWLQMRSRHNLGEMCAKLTYIPSLTPRGLTHFACPMAINLQNSSNLLQRITQNSMLHITLKYATMLAWMAIWW